MVTNAEQGGGAATLPGCGMDPGPEQPLEHVYIHLPYCSGKCRYCDFVSTIASPEERQTYLLALERELERRLACVPGPISTLYLGGGTPSLFAARDLEHLLTVLERCTEVGEEAEISIEVNPELARPELTALLELPFTRISVGCQTLDDGILKRIGRRHGSMDIVRTLEVLALSDREFSIDLMLGLPGQRWPQVVQALELVRSFCPKHVSVYQLDRPERADFAALLRACPSEDAVADWYGRVVDRLGQEGLARYEISNFSRPGYESRHNLAYWRHEEYLGLGASAVSFRWWQPPPVPTVVPTMVSERCWCRFRNDSEPTKYSDRVLIAGSACAGAEFLTPAQARFEFVFLALRTAEGLICDRFRQRFGSEVEHWYGAALRTQAEGGFLSMEGGSIRLTDRGILHSNRVFTALL